jgi:hypothetical protein
MTDKELIKEYADRNKKLCEARSKNLFDLNIDMYGKAKYYPTDKASEVIASMIESGKPFFVGRIGETELRTVDCYESKLYNIRYLRDVNYCICVNAGFFPKRSSKIRKFCNIYINSFTNMDALGIFLWANEEYYVQKYMKLRSCFLANVLDPLILDNPWTEALTGKKVLVVHPFSESIAMQYNKRDKLFKDENILPEFELKTVKAVQSVGGKGAPEFKSWFEALDYMKTQISECDFDIALLGCGAYGLPLASYIKDIGKQAIYMGGSLQLMFGIMGKRWENQEYVAKHVNEYWVRPSENERPKQRLKVEDGCYW